MSIIKEMDKVYAKNSALNKMAKEIDTLKAKIDALTPAGPTSKKKKTTFKKESPVVAKAVKKIKAKKTTPIKKAKAVKKTKPVKVAAKAKKPTMKELKEQIDAIIAKTKAGCTTTVGIVVQVFSNNGETPVAVSVISKFLNKYGYTDNQKRNHLCIAKKQGIISNPSTGYYNFLKV